MLIECGKLENEHICVKIYIYIFTSVGSFSNSQNMFLHFKSNLL